MINAVMMMLIHEVCKKCALTKKAIEYYAEQGLVSPSVQKNGYRNFSDEDAERLKRISVLRGLGLSVAEIRTALSRGTQAALYEISGKKLLEASALQEKQSLLQALASGGNWQQTSARLRQLEKKQSVLERLMNVFPGYYGRYICLHFAPYLNEPVTTDEQREAFDTIVAFLDTVSFDIPGDLREYIDRVIEDCDENFVSAMTDNMKNAVSDIEKYIADHREELENYMAYKQSDTYKQTPACRLEETLRNFTNTSRYNDVFLPAMRRLSKSYREYSEALQKADETLLQKYPQL